jgi:hypothetical protein
MKEYELPFTKVKAFSTDKSQSMIGAKTCLMGGIR